MFFFVLCQLFFRPYLSYAAEHQQTGIFIDQTVLSFAVSPGESRELEIGVGNHSAQQQTIVCSIFDVNIDDENQLRSIATKSENSDLSSWTSCGENQLVLEPGELKKVSFKLDVPQDASLGSHSAGIFFSSVPENANSNSQNMSVSARVGAYLLVNVTGADNGSGKISVFNAPFFYSNNFSLEVIYKNTGNIHYVPHGEIWIQNIFTQKKEKIELEKHFVFPGKEVSFESVWRGGSGFGAYLATAYFVDGNQRIQLSKRIMIGKFVFATFLCLGVAVITFLIIRKKRKKQIGKS